MILLDGRRISQQIIDGLKSKDLSSLSLHIVLIGDDPQSLKYVSLKQKKCEEIGLKCIIHHLPATTSRLKVINLINELNSSPDVTGYFIQLPIPKNHDKEKLLASILLKKDVDGLSPNSPFTPAVVRGVVSLLDAYHLSVAGKSAVIINDSKLIGIPLQKILEKRKAIVTVCNEFTKNIREFSRGADFLFTATGVSGLITADYIKPNAVVVDIGGGDVDLASVSPLCSYITPSVGGVGPMTIACLLQNLLDSSGII